MQLLTVGAVPKDDLGGDLLNSSGLVTSSEEYYPTVAINALMRALRDPAMSSHHPQVVRSLFYIFQALQLAAVPFLPKVSLSSLHQCAKVSLLTQSCMCCTAKMLLVALTNAPTADAASSVMTDASCLCL